MGLRHCPASQDGRLRCTAKTARAGAEDDDLAAGAGTGSVDAVVGTAIGSFRAVTYGQRIISAAEATAAAPELTQPSLRLSMEAAEPDHPAHEFFKNRYQDVRKITGGVISDLQAGERVPLPNHLAARVPRRRPGERAREG